MLDGAFCGLIRLFLGFDDVLFGAGLLRRDFRRLWIARINAAARLNGLSYSRLIGGLKKADVQLNRKMLAQLAVVDPGSFTAVVGAAKS